MFDHNCTDKSVFLLSYFQRLYQGRATFFADGPISAFRKVFEPVEILIRAQLNSPTVISKGIHGIRQ